MLRGRALRLTSFDIPGFLFSCAASSPLAFYQISVFFGCAVPVAAFVVELVAWKSEKKEFEEVAKQNKVACVIPVRCAFFVC